MPLRLLRSARPLLFLLFAALVLNLHQFIEGLPLDERSNSYLPERVLNVMALRDGEIPLWNPYNFAGVPHIPNQQCAFFYPLNLVAFLCLPPVLSMCFLAVAHFFLAGAFVFAYLRRLRIHPWAAAGGGLVFMIGGFLLGHEVHTAMFNSAVWMPLVFYFVEGLARRPNRKDLLGGALAYAMIVLAGFMYVAVGTAMMAGLYALIRAAGEGARRKVKGHLRRAWGGFVLCLVLVAWGGLISAIQILATRDILHETLREAMSFNEYSSFHFPISHLPMLWFPLFFGAVRGHAMPNYLGAPYLNEMIGWMGVLPLVFAAAGAAGWRACGRRRRGVLVAVFAIAIFGFLLCLGPQTPLGRIMYHVPVYNLFRAPARNWLFVNWAVAVLSAFGVHRLIVAAARRPERFRDAARAIAIFLGGTALAMLAFVAAIRALRVNTWPNAEIMDLAGRMSLFNPAIAAPILAVAGAAVVVGLWARTRRRFWLILAAFLLLGEAAFVKYYMSFDGSWHRVVYDDPKANPVYAWLRANEPDFNAFRIYPIRFQTGEGRFETLYPSINIPYRVSSLAGYGPFCPRMLYESVAAGNTGIIGNIEEFLEINRLFSILNVKYFPVWPLNSRYDSVLSTLESVRGENGAPLYRLVYCSPEGVRLYENLTVLPRAWAVRRVRTVTPDIVSRTKASLASVGWLYNPANRINLAEEALYPGQIPPELACDFTSATVRITHFGYNRIRAEVKCSADKSQCGDAFVIFSHHYYRGWRAYVDGKRSRIYPVDGVLSGVLVPPGAREIELVYHPKGFYNGLVISVLALLAAAGMILPRRLWESAWRRRGRACP